MKNTITRTLVTMRRKKSILALGALMATAGMAHAQSSVTLFGILDGGILYTNNNGGHSSWQTLSGPLLAPRWGLRVVEDLGGGLTAVSHLENGFSQFTGASLQGGRLFGRQAWTGLSSTQYGTLTMGRQYSPLQDFIAPLLISSGATGSALHPLDNEGFLTYRTDNSVKYVSPLYAGFQAETMYAFSNSPNFGTNRSWSVGATYTNGNLKLATAYVRLSEPAFNKDTNGAIPSDSYFSYSMTPFLATASSVQEWAVAGRYAVGHANFGLLYTNTRFENPSTGSLFSGATGSGGGTGSVRFQNVEGSVRYDFASDLIGSLGETYTHATEGPASGNYWQTNAGVSYFLSKRTNLYVDAFYQKTSRNLNAWIMLTGAPSSTSTQVAAVFGLCHRF